MIEVLSIIDSDHDDLIKLDIVSKVNIIALVVLFIIIINYLHNIILLCVILGAASDW